MTAFLVMVVMPALVVAGLAYWVGFRDGIKHEEDRFRRYAEGRARAERQR